MALKTPVVDRIPTYPGRVKLTPVSGQTNTYDLVRADQPIEEGTHINKVLFDQKAYTLTGDVTLYVATTGSDVTGDGTSAAPYATIQKAVDSLPKWMDGHTATISIANGTYEETVSLVGFQGGILELGLVSQSVTVRGILVNASSYIRINTSITSLTSTTLIIRNGSQVQICKAITIDGGSAKASGISVQTGSTLGVLTDFFEYTTVTVKNTSFAAVHAFGGARAHLGSIVGSNNAVGLRVDEGGIITYGMNTMTANTATIMTTGGRIYTEV